jgi:hypothetical protein
MGDCRAICRVQGIIVENSWLGSINILRTHDVPAVQAGMYNFCKHVHLVYTCCSYAASINVMCTHADRSEASLLEHAISSSCSSCARLWFNLGNAKLRAGSNVQAERACRTAYRLGLKRSMVRRTLADALDAQGRKLGTESQKIL